MAVILGLGSPVMIDAHKVGVARANVEFSVRDPKSGQGFASTYRQVLMFRDEKISRMEQHHDAPSASAFMSTLKKE